MYIVPLKMAYFGNFRLFFKILLSNCILCFTWVSA